MHNQVAFALAVYAVVLSTHGGGPTMMESTVLAVAIILVRERKSSWAC